jgi:hypothetical protein
LFGLSRSVSQNTIEKNVVDLDYSITVDPGIHRPFSVAIGCWDRLWYRSKISSQWSGIEELLRGLLEAIFVAEIKRSRREILINLRSRANESLKMPADANISSSLDHNSLKIML